MTDSMWVELLAPTFKVLFLSVSLVGIALGVCLIVRGAATLRTMQGMNRWVSSRRAMKPLEIPHNVEPVARSGRGGIGIVVAAVGIYSFIVLILQFDPGKLASVLGQHPRYSIAAIAIDGLRWLLIAGSALAAVVGVMMLVAPHALRTLESVGNRWISTRRVVAGGDTMHVPLDRFAEHHPRVAGVLIAGLSLAATAASVILLLR